MHEVTHIAYGEGGVNIVLDSSSQTQVAAPNFRFGDYTTVVSSCFTPRELEKISAGESADITFYFVVTDEIDNGIIDVQFQRAIQDNEAVIGNLNEGILIDVSATKSVGEAEEVMLTNSSTDLELQMDIPLFLVKENRSYFFMMDKSGNYELLSDASPDAEVLTVSTHVFTPGVMLYQDAVESLVHEEEKSFNLEIRHFLLAGIVVLIILWFFIDHLHKKSF